MPQYLIHAFDPIDSEALERRMLVRPRHLEGVSKLKSAGHYLIGGAILDSEDRMIGSAIILDFPNDAAFHDYLRHEPYITEGIWERYEVKPFRVAAVP